MQINIILTFYFIPTEIRAWRPANIQSRFCTANWATSHINGESNRVMLATARAKYQYLPLGKRRSQANVYTKQILETGKV